MIASFLPLMIGLFMIHSPATVTPDPPRVVREDIEWSQIWIPGVNATDKRHILLIGDSITNAYFPVVEKQFATTAYVAKLATSKSLGDPALLKEVELVVGHAHFDVIHFNNGMHGVGYTEEEYRRDFARMVKLLQKLAPQTRLIYGTTTAKRTANRLETFDPFNERIKARNQIAHDLLARQKIPIDDLYALVVDAPDLYSTDGTHFNGKGVEATGNHVCEAITVALKGE